MHYKYYTVPYNVMHHFICRTTYRALCLGWYQHYTKLVEGHKIFHSQPQLISI